MADAERRILEVHRANLVGGFVSLRIAHAVLGDHVGGALCFGSAKVLRGSVPLRFAVLAAFQAKLA